MELLMLQLVPVAAGQAPWRGFGPCQLALFQPVSGLFQVMACARGCPQTAIWMWPCGCGTHRVAWIRERGPSLPWLLCSGIDVLRGAGRWTVKKQGYKRVSVTVQKWGKRYAKPIPTSLCPVFSLPFIYCAFTLPVCPLASQLPPWPFLPFHQQLSALGPSPLLPSLQLHFSDALLLLLLLPFAAPILSTLYLAFWLFFLAMTQFLPEPYHHFFCFLLPLLCPLHLLHAPACYLQSAAQLQFLLHQLLPNPSPPGSFFSLLLHFIVLFSFSDIVSTSHIPSLRSPVLLLLLHGCPFPLPPRWFPGSPCCSRSVCSLPAFVSRSVSPLPSLFSAFSSLGLLLSQGKVV